MKIGDRKEMKIGSKLVDLAISGSGVLAALQLVSLHSPPY